MSNVINLDLKKEHSKKFVARMVIQRSSFPGKDIPRGSLPVERTRGHSLLGDDIR